MFRLKEIILQRVTLLRKEITLQGVTVLQNEILHHGAIHPQVVRIRRLSGVLHLHPEAAAAAVQGGAVPEEAEDRSS